MYVHLRLTTAERLYYMLAMLKFQVSEPFHMPFIAPYGVSYYKCFDCRRNDMQAAQVAPELIVMT